MGNFDFTQFISVDSYLAYENVRNRVMEIFSKQRFSLIEFKDIEISKKDYFSEHWRKYNFELEKDDFLGAFINWEMMGDVPQEIECFMEGINELRTLAISNLSVIICSFAEKGKTSNEYVRIDAKNISVELFKMSPFSFRCPDNLIVEIEEK